MEIATPESTFTELSPIQYPPQVAGDIGMIATDPAGHVIYKVTDKYFVVTELP
ncbi:MAG TPA: hypothetical protein VFL16_07970 [Steroidobacteraceae bacterium]|nr:hypothetical protein [Steroidobacteraceae bacterium]